MSEELRKLISDHGVLNGLTEEQVVAICERCEVKSFEAKEEIIRAGETGADLYLLVEGRCAIEVDVTEQVRHFVVEHLEEGDIFGEMSFLDNGPRSATVVSATPCQVMVMSLPVFRSLIREQPEIGTVVMKNIAVIIARKMRKTHQRLKNLYWKGQVSS